MFQVLTPKSLQGLITLNKSINLIFSRQGNTDWYRGLWTRSVLGPDPSHQTGDF